MLYVAILALNVLHIGSSSVPDERYFIVATRDAIAQVSLDGQRYQALVSDLQNAVAIDYDYRYKNLLVNIIVILKSGGIPIFQGRFCELNFNG